MSRRSRIRQVAVSRFIEQSHMKEYNADRQPFLLSPTGQIYKMRVETTFVETVDINVKIEVGEQTSKPRDVSKVYGNSEGKRQLQRKLQMASNRQTPPLRKKNEDEKMKVTSRKLKINDNLSQRKRKPWDNRSLSRSKSPFMHKRPDDGGSHILQLAKVKSGKTSLRRTKLGTDKAGLRRTKSYEHLLGKSKGHGHDNFKEKHDDKRSAQSEIFPVRNRGKINNMLVRSASLDDIKLLKADDQDTILPHLRRDIKLKQLAEIYGGSDRYKNTEIKSNNTKLTEKEKKKLPGNIDKAKSGKESTKKSPRNPIQHETSSNKNSNKSNPTRRTPVSSSDTASVNKIKATNKLQAVNSVKHFRKESKTRK